MQSNHSTKMLSNLKLHARITVLPLIMLVGCDDAPAADPSDAGKASSLETELDPKLALTLLGSSPDIGDHGQLIDGDPNTALWSSKPGPDDGWHHVDLDLGGRKNVSAIRLLEDDMVEWAGWGIDQWEIEIFDGEAQKYWSGTMESTTNAWQTVDNEDVQGDHVRLWLFSSNSLVSVRELEVRGTALDTPPCDDHPSDDPPSDDPPADDPPADDPPTDDPPADDPPADDPPADDPPGDVGGSITGMPDAPGGWVLDLDDDFDTLEWNNWKQWQNNLPLYHSVMYWNTQTHCVPVDGYLEMRARKRDDGTGTWDGCYIDQGTWWDGGNDRPAHPGYADYQVSFKAEMPAGLGTGMYALMWPVAESWGGTPWPPELDIVELPFNDGSQVMTTWHYANPDHAYDSVFPQFDRTGGKQWVYTVRREAGVTRMWIGDPDTGSTTEVAMPESVNTIPHADKRLLFGMSNFVASTWALTGNTSEGSASWYGDANATDATAWTGRVDWVKIYKPGPGMAGE